MRIDVTKPYLPDSEEYKDYVNQIWESGWLTNGGNLLQRLTNELTSFLGVEDLVLMSNGTIPIQMALYNLANEGEVITTPFSYVATTSSILWQSCKPVFVDIDPKYLTIDELKIEDAITSKTTAILATHVFGNPCNIDVLREIASRHNLSLIYDAAHCFGVTYRDQSIFNFGDVSTCSFHATKVFHTVEGGAAISTNKELLRKISYNIHFGHKGPYDFFGIGINGKMSELHAAMGLAVLPKMAGIINNRKKTVEHYMAELAALPLKFINIRPETTWNYSYFPITFESEEKLLNTISDLNQRYIFPRRYFYPSLNTIHYINGAKMPVSEDISSRVLCLPLYFGLEPDDISIICHIIKNALN